MPLFIKPGSSEAWAQNKAPCHSPWLWWDCPPKQSEADRHHTGGEIQKWVVSSPPHTIFSQAGGLVLLSFHSFFGPEPSAASLSTRPYSPGLSVSREKLSLSQLSAQRGWGRVEVRHPKPGQPLGFWEAEGSS